MRRLLGAGASLVLALAVLYLVAANVFLRTRALRHLLSSSPEDMIVEYASAYSIIPGRIHVEGLRIRGSDSHVQWILVLDRCDFRFWPLDVVRRRFHASHVRGDGLSFRLRLKLDVHDATPAVALALPPVPGFSDPPYKSTAPPSPPLSDADYNLVSVQLDDVEAAHVREVWVQTLRFTGDTRITGRWLFRPVRWLDVGPAHIDVATLRVAHGPNVAVATGLTGEIDATVHPFDVRVPQGLEILEHLSVAATLTGAIAPAGIASAFLAADGITASPGEGSIALRLHVDHGRATAGSRVSASIGLADVTRGGIELRSGAAAELGVDKDGAGHGRLDLTEPRGFWRGNEVVQANDTSVTLVRIGTNLAKPSLEDAMFSADVKGFQAASTSPMEDTVRARTGFSIHAQAVAGDAAVTGRVRDTVMSGILHLSAGSLAVSRAENSIEARPTATVVFDDASVRDASARVSGSEVVLRDVVARLGGFTGRVQTLHASLQDGAVAHGAVSVHDAEATAHALVLSHRASASPLFSAPWVAIRAQDVQAASKPAAHLEGALSVELLHGTLPDLPALARVAAMPRVVQVLGGHGTITGRVGLDLASLTMQGSVRATTRGMRLRLGTESFATDLTAEVAMHPSKSGRPVTDLSGSTLVAMSPADSGADGWWARASVPGGATIGLRTGASVVASLRVEAENARPAEALLASASGVPRWLLEIAPMDQLTAVANVVASRGSFELRALEAHGGPTWVRAEYAKRGSVGLGGALVHVGGADVGINLGGQGPGFILFGADGWFERKVAPLVTTGCVASMSPAP